VNYKDQPSMVMAAVRQRSAACVTLSRNSSPGEELREKVTQASDLCPTAAITIEG
jgi:ferredoxin